MDTRYYGIWIQIEDGHYWIQDTNGGERYVGDRMPTEAEIDAYRLDALC